MGMPGATASTPVGGLALVISSSCRNWLDAARLAVTKTLQRAAIGKN